MGVKKQCGDWKKEEIYQKWGFNDFHNQKHILSNADEKKFDA